MHEIRTGDVAEIDFQAIFEELDVQLHQNPSAAKANVCRLLGRNPAPFDTEECVGKTQAALQEKTAEQVQDCKYRLSSEASEVLASGSEVEAGLETPNMYMKRLGLSHDMRPELRRARASTIAETHSQLTARINQDTHHENYETGVDDEELEEGIEAYRRATAIEVATLVDEIKDIQPSLPVRHKIGRAILWMLRAGSEELRGAPRPTFSKEQDRALETAMTMLKDALARFKQGPDAVAQVIADQYAGVVNEPMEDELEQRYRGFISESLEALPGRLENAYEQAAQHGPRYRPRPTPTPSLEEAVLVELLEQEPDTQEIRFRDLGEIRSPFPWLAEGNVRISSMEDGQRRILFCEALIPEARDLSRSLRADSGNTKKLDNLRERIKEIEFAGNAATHNQIRPVKHAHFYDLPVHYFSSHTDNGLRVYYVKLAAGDFRLADQPDSIADLDPETPLVVLIAETDKAHQPKVLKTLGIGQRFAKVRRRRSGAPN